MRHVASCLAAILVVLTILAARESAPGAAAAAPDDASPAGTPVKAAKPIDPPAPLPPIKTVAIGKNREFVVNGKPFLPIMGWLQGPGNLPKLKAVGINTIAGYWRPADGKPGAGGGAHGYDKLAQKAGLYFIPPFEPKYADEMKALKGSDNVLCWIHEDEPDMPKRTGDRKELRQTPEQVMERYRALKSLDSMRPIMMTVTCFFINDSRFDHWWTKEESDRIYPQLFKAADIPGFDVYPIYGWNAPDKLTWVSQGIDELRAYAGRNKPTYIWLECLPGSKFGDKAHPVTGLEMRNEVYQAIIHGATAVGYFTHRFGDNFSEFAPSQENQNAMLEINRQLQRLASAIVGPDAKAQPTMTIAGDLTAQCLAKQDDGSLVIFAQNIDMGRKGGMATISLKGLKPGARIEVVDEDRSVEAQVGKFSDEFGPLAVHIYRVRM